MTRLLTNVITVRGEDYEVSELSAGTMKGVRKTVTDPSPDKSEMEAFVAQRCLVRPSMSLNQVLDLPSAVVTAIATEAWRLTLPPKEGEPKKD